MRGKGIGDRGKQAKELTATKNMHLLDALSEVGFNDPAMMRGLARKELAGRR